MTNDFGLTGIDFLDRALPVDHDSIGVHAVLGSTGTGITTLTSMVAAEGALRRFKRRTNGDEARWLFATTQETTRQTRARMICCVGRLSFGSFEHGELRCLDQDKNPAEQWTFGESIVDQAMRFVDTSELSTSSWGTPAHLVDQLLDAMDGDKGIAGITFDDVPSLLERRLESSGGCGAGFTRLMTNFLHECGELAKRWRCPVWIGHQLRGAVAKSAPRAVVTHGDAMLYKHLGRSLKTSFVIGNHVDSGVFQIRCTKPFLNDEDLLAVVRIVGGARIEEVDSQFRAEFLTDSWKMPSLKIRVEDLELLLERRKELMNSSREDEVATRMVRAAGIEK
ncbi:MAG: hypothetical protein H6824_03540 [Planctomycetaceae bacterium]|nr:hypothetical protein [Planctomycetaceae bacterium]